MRKSVQHLVVWLWGIVWGLSFSPVAFPALSGSLEESQVLLRLQPEARLNIEQGGQIMQGNPAALQPPTITNIGQHRYEETCHICHATGLAGAPLFKDKVEWAPRIADGMDLLVKRAIEGYKAMPPKGGCGTCSDAEIKKAVEYMVVNAQ